MPEPVIYEMGLKDKFSPVIGEAEKSATHFEGTIQRTSETVKELAGAITAAFGIYKLDEFIRTSDEAYSHLVEANAQIKAGLESTHYQAGVTFDDLTESQDKFRKQVDYTKDAIADMQSQILTFPGITKTNFDLASQAVLDMATRTHRSLNTVAVEVGKALQDPQIGMLNLRRVGVDFNDVQVAMVRHMLATGHAAEAQNYILQRLAETYAGSAAAAREADPLAEYKESYEELQYTLGELVEKIQVDLAPTLVSIVTWFKGVVEWIGRNREELASLIKVIGEAVLVYKGLSFVTGIMQSIAVATTEATGASAAFATTMGTVQSALGPVIISLTAILGIYNALKDSLITVNEMQGNITPDMKTNLKKQSELDVDYEAQRLEYAGIGPKDKNTDLAITNVREDYEKQLKEAQKTIDWYTDAAKKLPLGGLFADNAEDYQKAIAQVSTLKEKIQDLDNMRTNKQNVEMGKKYAAANPILGTEKGTKAIGSKNINIKIDIKEMIHEFKINTTNLHESVAKTKDLVAAALISAVNDSQIVAGE